jgi:D-alanyl-D-alanine dipeptidase
VGFLSVLFQAAAVLVDLAVMDPGIRLDIRYATERNFLGRPVYRQARAFLRPEVAEALKEVNRSLAAHGYGLLVFDAYRPLSVTRLFWEELPKEKRRFVANPARGSQHNRGCAVDLSLYHLDTLREVEMPSAYDEMTERASPAYGGGEASARDRRELLRQAMEAGGFKVNRGEWWHFDHHSCPRYDLLDVPFEAIAAEKE